MCVSLTLISLGSAMGTGRLGLFVRKTEGREGVDRNQWRKQLPSGYAEGKTTLVPKAVLQQPFVLFHTSYF